MKQLIWSSLLAVTILALGSACSKKSDNGGNNNAQPYAYQGNCNQGYTPGVNYNHSNYAQQQNTQLGYTQQGYHQQNNQQQYAGNTYGQAQHCMPTQFIPPGGYHQQFSFGYGVMTCDKRLETSWDGRPRRVCPTGFRCVNEYSNGYSYYYNSIGTCVSNNYY